MSLVIGVDMGASTTRALLADTAGRRLGGAITGPGNPFAYPPEQAAAALAGALRHALTGHDPADVALGLIGLAGGARLADPDAAATFDAAWRDAGLHCPMRLAGDTDVAFAAGTAAADGAVLIAGTGAVAATIREHRMVRQFGGWGWLLGDEGAGCWLGRQAVRTLLYVLEGSAPAGVLSDAVHAALSAPATTTVDDLVTTVDHANPVRLARLAPLVSDAAEAGDPAALDIVEAATRHLARLAGTACADSAGAPLVLAGSVAADGTPVGRSLRRRLAAEVGPVLSAVDGAAGAAWLAARQLPDPPDPGRLHAALFTAESP